MIGSNSEQRQPKRLYVSAVKGNEQTQYEDDVMIVEVPDKKLPVKVRLGDFPQLERQNTIVNDEIEVAKSRTRIN